MHLHALELSVRTKLQNAGVRIAMNGVRAFIGGKEQSAIERCLLRVAMRIHHHFKRRSVQLTTLVVLHVHVAVGIRFLDRAIRTEVDQRLLRGVVLPGIARVVLQQGELPSVAIELGMLGNQHQRTFCQLRGEVDILLQDQHAFIRVIGAPTAVPFASATENATGASVLRLAGLLIEDNAAGFGMHGAILRGGPARARRRLHIQMYRPQSTRGALQRRRIRSHRRKRGRCESRPCRRA